jgi:hypothetical protein
MVAAPRGTIVEANLYFARLDAPSRQTPVDVFKLKPDWQLIADQNGRPPIAVRLVGTTLYVSVTPPRLSRAAPQSPSATVIDEKIVGKWSWSNGMG